MVDKERVCCLCGDVGFPQQLFRCSRCRFRFQHSYCSNYYKYGKEAEAKAKDNKCDWCQYESGKNPSSPWSSSSTNKKVHAGTSSASKRPLSSSSSETYNNNNNHNHIRSEYTTGSGGPRIIKMVHDNNGNNGNNGNNNNNDSTNINVMENPSSKPATKYNSTPNSSGVPSPRPNGHRRYKLLKDVMC